MVFRFVLGQAFRADPVPVIEGDVSAMKVIRVGGEFHAAQDAVLVIVGGRWGESAGAEGGVQHESLIETQA